MLEFEVGEHMFVKVPPLKASLQFRKHGKLSSRFIGLFEILQKVGPVV